MTNEEAIKQLNMHKSTNVWADSIAEAIDIAIEALNREQQIIENGYTGKEIRIRIGGRLFAVGSWHNDEERNGGDAE